MISFFYISLGIGFLYLLLVLVFITGWIRTKPFYRTQKSQNIFLSLVVCCRNEAKNLPSLFDSIQKQTYKNVEIILADDHSTDQTASLLKDFSKKHPNTIFFHAKKRGKKQVLAEAILHSSGELICCTDADCKLKKDHLKIISEFYQSEYPDLILGAVRMNSNGSFFQEVQALEFQSLIVSGAGAAGAGIPILCNGANLAFTRDAWFSAQNELKNEEPSGDDLFLMHYLKKTNAKIRFLKSKETIVETAPCETLQEFVNQRARWASKSKSYTDKHTIFTAILVFSYAWILLIGFILSFFSLVNLMLFLFLFCSKLIVDTFLLFASASFFNTKKVFKNAFFLSLIYPLYILSTSIKGFLGNFKWKNRFYSPFN